MFTVQPEGVLIERTNAKSAFMEMDTESVFKEASPGISPIRNFRRHATTPRYVIMSNMGGKVLIF
jgi:hypothetical protein